MEKEEFKLQKIMLEEIDIKYYMEVEEEIDEKFNVDYAELERKFKEGLQII